MACEICSRLTHEWYDCPKRPEGYVPLVRRERKESKNSADQAPSLRRQQPGGIKALTGVPPAQGIEDSLPPAAVAPNKSGAVAERDGGKSTRNATAKHVAPVLPTSADESAVDAGSNPAGSAKPKLGRPRLHADRRAYKALKAREYRAAKKVKSDG